ncbi:MAG: YceI family protein [Cyclobacteriaceae bacterium]|nr:YceI family protein [Cyclobacteriaceae bacterium]
MRILLFFLFAITACVTNAQSLYQATSSKISFFAGTPVEDIDAINTKAWSFFNSTTGEISINIPIKDFHFKRPLMEEHFNENYLESSKYPKAQFKGKIKDVEKINFKSIESIEISITGTLTLHGVSKETEINVVLHSEDGKIQGETKFFITLSDYKIDRPKILWEKLAEKVNVTAAFTYEPYNK